jgi:hypothetical protein
MKRLMLLVVVAVWPCAGQIGAQGAGGDQKLNGTFLLENCDPDSSRQLPLDKGLRNAAWCLGYITGFSDGSVSARIFRAARDKGKPYTEQFCPPEGVDNEQMLRVIVAYLKAQPSKLHLETWGLSLTALVEASPCATTP